MRILALAVALCAAAWPAAADTYRIDAGYSVVSLSEKHLFFFHWTPEFNSVNGTFDYEPGKPELWKASVTIAADSVSTGSPKRDAKLKSRRFLNAAEDKTIAFVSTAVHKGLRGVIKMDGDLTIRGQTHPIVLDVDPLVPLEPGLQRRVGLAAHGRIDRRLWRIPGGFLVSRWVDIQVQLQGTPAAQ